MAAARVAMVPQVERLDRVCKVGVGEMEITHPVEQEMKITAVSVAVVTADLEPAHMVLAPVVGVDLRAAAAVAVVRPAMPAVVVAVVVVLNYRVLPPE